MFDVLDYDPDTGVFTNRITRNPRALIGTEAGSLKANGYIEVQIGGFKYKAHRLAWFYEYAKWPVGLIDHKDRVRHNNSISNLRQSDHSSNAANVSKTYGTSKYKGVSWDSENKKWKAQITFNNKTKYLGRFVEEKTAAEAYNIAAKKLFKEFAVLNEVIITP